MRRIITFILLTIGIISISCGNKDQSESDEQLRLAQALQNENDLLCREAADKLTTIFSRELKGELMSAMSQGGAVKAIDICRYQAPKISRIFSINGVKIARVAERYRNLDNRATLKEIEIMKKFEDTLTTPEYLGEWTHSDSAETYHYYKPIYTQPICLNCHGGLQTLSPGVIDAVRKHYPSDKATGFKVGELRGIFVVEIAWPVGKAYAEEIRAFELDPPAEGK
ncbi:MAG: Tll0287-like domain-containing protein [Candidatus Zixiibacteriota bacterium]